MSSKIIYSKIKGYHSDIIEYFPEYKENPEYLPPKRFMWDIFSTKDTILANKFISHSLKERNLEDSEGGRTVKVSEDVLNQLHVAHYFSKKKGKVLFMLSASKELGTIKRKRKRSIKSFDPLCKEEEKKEVKKKRSKLNDDNNQKITEWLLPKISKKDKKDKKEKDDRKEKETNNEDMNIDLDSQRINNPFIKSSKILFIKLM